MGAVFSKGKGNGPNQLNGIRLPQSKQGFPIPAGMGQFRAQQCLVWLDGVRVAQVSQGGGKGGGGKGGSSDLYSANAICVLCNGPVTSIGNVWSGQTWLSSNQAYETVTVESVYAPTNAIYLVADNGVAFAQTYSDTYNDYGAPAATVLSGTDYAPLTLIPWYPQAKSTAYSVGQQVFNGTYVYTCVKANTNVNPTNATYWTSTGAGLTTGEYSVNPLTIGTFAVTSATVSGGSVVYAGTFTGGVAPYSSGASNNFVGFAFTIAGFPDAGNNGTFVCTASTATSVTLTNASGVNETHAATATETGSTYHFSGADIGSTAVVAYQFSTQNFQDTTVSLVPSTGQISVGGSFTPVTDEGVIYYNNGNDLDGTALTAVSGTPSAAGEYHFSTPAPGNSGGGSYAFYVDGGFGGE
jgi:hypothetical protein